MDLSSESRRKIPTTTSRMGGVPVDGNTRRASSRILELLVLQLIGNTASCPRLGWMRGTPRRLCGSSTTTGLRQPPSRGPSRSGRAAERCLSAQSAGARPEGYDRASFAVGDSFASASVPIGGEILRHYRAEFFCERKGSARRPAGMTNITPCSVRLYDPQGEEIATLSEFIDWVLETEPVP
jgi:hypothetical protein